MINEVRLEKSISVKLLRVVFGIYFVLILGITGLQLVFEFYNSRQMVVDELKTIELASISALDDALWVLDEQQIQSIAMGLLELKIVKGLVIFDDHGKKVFSKGLVSGQSGSFFHSFSINHQQLSRDLLDQSVYLAEVKVFSDNLIVFERIEARVYSFLLGAIVKTIILFLLLLWAFKRYLLIPLGQFVEAIRSIGLTKSRNKAISLELKDKNELKLIELAFNEMLETLELQKTQLIKQEKALVGVMTNQNEELERIVEIRTCELQISNEKLLALANTDPLTGLNNRRYFFELGDKLLAIANRTHQPISIIMCDIDHFKKINDTFGHAMGDKVLINFSKTISVLLRNSEVFARVGGEEFAIIVINSNVENTLNLANRIQDCIKKIVTVTEKNEEIRFTMSMGITACHAGEQKVESGLQRADEQLYHAKHSGRDRTSY